MAILWLVANLVYLGWSFEAILKEAGVATNSLPLVNSYLLPALFAMLVSRFFFERGPQLQIRSYLHLPISRRKLSRFATYSALVSVYNLWPLAFLIPLSFRSILPRYGTIGLTCYIGGCVLLLITTTYVVLLAQQIFGRRPFLFIVGIGFTGLLVGALDLINFISLRGASASFFNELVRGNLFLFSLLIALGLSSGYVFYQTALRHAYMGTKQSLSSQHVTRSISHSNPNGTVPNLILLNLRLVLRNRLPRMQSLASPLLSAMLVAMALHSLTLWDGMWPFVGVFASGAFIIHPGQHLFKMNASWYDALLSKGVSLSDYACAELWMLQGSCLFAFVLFLPLFLVWKPHLLIFHLVFLIYNMGISTPVIIMAAAFISKKRLNLWRGIFLNYEMTSLSQLLLMMPLFALPYLIWLVVGSKQIAWVVLALLGMVGLVSTPLWVRAIARILERRKHKMAAAFRK